MAMSITSETRTLAQSVVPDGSLGSTVTNLGGQIQINGGTPIAETNLFHSFQEFNVDEGGSVFFNSPAGIENILTRVTGTNPSNILGTLGVLGNANLFLINPNGVIFGENASLDIGGSFVATTANAILLGNTGRFSASLDEPSNLLAIQPSAFFFNQLFNPTNPTIVNQSTAINFSTNTRRFTQGLQVPNGQSLLLVGGDVSVEGGIVQAPGGRVELAGIVQGTIPLNLNDNTLSLNIPDEATRADVSLTDGAFVNVVNRGGGDILINARNINLAGSSTLLAGVRFGAATDARAGDIRLNATETLTITDASDITNIVADVGNGGNIRIDTRQFFLEDSIVSNSTPADSSNAGTLIVNASESVDVSATSVDGRVVLDNPFLSSNVRLPVGLFTAPVGGAGRSSGELRITTGRLTVQGGARLSVGTDNQTRGGDLNINASDLVELIGTAPDGSPTVVASGTQGIGASGDVTIETRRLVVRDGAIASAGTSSQGQGGRLTVRAWEFVELLGTANVTITDSSLINIIGTSVSQFIGVRPLPSGLITGTAGEGRSGDLTIDTGRLVIRGGAQASTSTGGLGNGGELQVIAPEIELSGVSPDGYFSSGLVIESRSAGNAGSLKINTDTMILRDGGQVLASTSGEGDAGTLEVNAANSVQVIGTSANGTPSSLFFDTSGSGNAGILSITTGQLQVQNGGRVSAGTTSTGQGGKLTVNAREFVEVSGTSTDGQTPSRLFFDTSNAGDAGELRITTPALRIWEGGQVSARTSGAGQGGVLEVRASDIVDVRGTSGQFRSGLYFDTSSTANARGISIETGRLELQDGGQINISGTGAGAAGDLEVEADSIFLNRQGRLTASSTSGEGGNIRLRVRDSILMRDNSEITTEASGSGNGGNIDIEAGGVILAILSENSDVVANAFQGQGGNIFATASGVYGFRRFEKRRTPESDFTASSQLGIDGVVDIDVRNEPEAVPLEESIVNAEIIQSCQEITGDNQSEFIITGRGGLPDNPESSLNHDAVWTDWRNPNGANPIPPQESVDTQSHHPQLPLVEANRWEINSQGQVVLIATNPNPHHPTLIPSQCDVSQTSKE
jgi:filamentous hemagglutinin family protein